MIYQGIVTNEGLSKSQDVANNVGFQLTPYKFAVSEFLGAFDASRDINSLEATWYEGSISSFVKIDDATIQFNCNIPAGTSPVPRFTKEIYVIATDGVDDFLLCFAQPTVELTYDPEAELRVRIQFKINNIEVGNLYNFSYTQATEISDHNADSNAHPDIQAALNDFGIYVNSPNQFVGQYIDRFPVLGPSVVNLNAVYWNTITNRYEPALATDPISKNAVGIYIQSKNTVVFGGVIQFTNGSPAYTKVYLSTVVPGLLTLSPSDTIIGYTLPNNKLLIDIEVAVSELEVVDPDGNKSVILEPPLEREMVLLDSNDVAWEVTISNDGILSTETTIKEVTPIFKITKPNLAFAQVMVDTDGNLFIEAPPQDNSILADDFYYIRSPDGTYWKFTVDLSNQIVMTNFDNTYSVKADNGTVLFDVQQTDQFKAVQGVSTYTLDTLPNTIVPSAGLTKWAFLDLGSDVVVPIYWDGYRWQRWSSGSLGDYKYSLLNDAQFASINGDGWVRAVGQSIIGSRLHAFTGKTRLPDGRGTSLKGVVDIDPIEFIPNDVDINNESIFLPDHPYRTGMKVMFTTTGTLPTGLDVLGAYVAETGNTGKYNNYYVIVVDADNIKVATTWDNAFAGTAVNITGQGTGVHTVIQGQDADPRYDQETGLVSTDVGSWQDDSTRSHRHSIDSYDEANAGGSNSAGVDASGYTGDNAITRFSGSKQTTTQNISGYLYIKIN